MKNLYFVWLSFTCIIGSIESFAQGYQPFIRNDVLWRVEFSSADAGQLNYLYYNSYVCCTDSQCSQVIDGKTYVTMSDELIREDTALKKVYIISGDTEKILYDFNLDVGDSITEAFSSIWPEGAWVSSIGSITIDGTQRRKILFSVYECGFTWIEGVGSTSGPIVTPGDCWHIGRDLICYRYLNDTSLTPLYGTGCSTVGFSEKVQENPLVIFPNPATTEWNIQTLKKLNSLKVYDYLGREMGVTVRKEGQGYSIEIRNLPSGMYFLKAETDGGLVTKRVVKQ